VPPKNLVGFVIVELAGRGFGRLRPCSTVYSVVA
jgi:hypothetical protein